MKRRTNERWKVNREPNHDERVDGAGVADQTGGNDQQNRRSPREDRETRASCPEPAGAPPAHNAASERRPPSQRREARRHRRRSK